MSGFWIFMLVMDVLIPFTMIGFGRLFVKSAPEKINRVFGYRTAMSMKNMDTWEFAHHYCGKLWTKLGLGLLVLSVVPLLFYIRKEIDEIAIVGLLICCVQLVVLLLSIIPMERALKKSFNEDGTRR